MKRAISHDRGCRAAKATMPVVTLKIRWLMPTRFLAWVPPMAPSSTVMVVPILAPMTRASDVKGDQAAVQGGQGDGDAGGAGLHQGSDRHADQDIKPEAVIGSSAD